jgi:hypothetical protein
VSDQSSGRNLMEVIRRAQDQLGALTGRHPEGVSALRRTDQGWSMEVELVELERVPASTSILGTYQVSVDRDGNLLEYSRLSRYHRNQAGDGDQ